MIDLSIKCPGFAANVCTAVNSWLSAHYAIAWVALAIIVIGLLLKWLADFIPQIQKIKADVLIPWAKEREHGRLVKAAIKADIESRVNTTIMTFGNKLPSGWISKMKIDWAENESKNDFFNDGEMVLKVRPLKDQARNFVRASHAFLQKAFFPRAKNVVPLEHREASVLFTGRKIMGDQGQNVKELFEDIILEPAIDGNKRILPIMQRYEYLDRRGFFMGAFLREVHAVAIGARFDAATRNRMREEVNGLLDHVEDFIRGIPRMPASLWSRRGPVTNYAFLLVANPTNVETNNIPAFVNKAREHLNGGVDRLYVFGSEDSRLFGSRVVAAIKQQTPEYKISEKFNLSNDFRGQSGGFGTLFVRLN